MTGQWTVQYGAGVPNTACHLWSCACVLDQMKSVEMVAGRWVERL